MVSIYLSKKQSRTDASIINNNNPQSPKVVDTVGWGSLFRGKI